MAVNSNIQTDDGIDQILSRPPKPEYVSPKETFDDLYPQDQWVSRYYAALRIHRPSNR